MEMYVAGEWITTPVRTPIRNPFTGKNVGEASVAGPELVEAAIASAVRGAAAMRALSPKERAGILSRAADLLAADADGMARTITEEEGKPLFESRPEAERMPDLLRLCAFEGSQFRGETLPLESRSGMEGRLGLTVRVPCGVVFAVTPYNYPLLLVVHKVGPALAAGNAVILKPATLTPMTALRLVRHLLAAGLPPEAIQCLTGSGAAIGAQVAPDPRVRKISFTGSAATGAAIGRVAGGKPLSLELGAACPVVILPDADIALAATAVASAGFVNAGQVCISAQRVIVHEAVYDSFVDSLAAETAAIVVGDPMDEATRLAAMITESEAVRVESWVREAVAAGARVAAGGARDGAIHTATVIVDADPRMKVMAEELFGPAVAVLPTPSLDDALAMANASQFGLGAAVFTKDLGLALRFAERIETGMVHINWGPLWRTDLMPYGGVKQSGFGREGPRYAVQEMTEIKTVVIHGA